MPNVAVLTGSSCARTHDFLRGVYDFAASALDWAVQPFDAHEPLVVHEIQTWGAQALVVQLDRLPQAAVRALASVSVPYVVFQTAPLGTAPNLGPAVAVAPDSLSRLIAQHTQSTSTARIGLITRQPNDQLAKSMSSSFGERFQNFALTLSPAQLRSLTPTMSPEICRWLAGNGHSVLVAEDDSVAVYLRRALLGLRFKVPQDVSLVSLVDSLVCNLPLYSITAVILPDRELGYQAARIISRTLSGLPAPTETTLIDALHLTCRASSVESGQDLAIDRARKFIEENATRGITVSDVMTFQQTSRVTFERQFQAALGCTPGDYIRQIKVGKAKALLLESSQSIESIGKVCGYQSPAKFSSFFKRAVGISPAAFRLRGQQG